MLHYAFINVALCIYEVKKLSKKVLYKKKYFNILYLYSVTIIQNN